MSVPAVLRAPIRDVDGTLAETGRDGHRVAFNGALEDPGVACRASTEPAGSL